MWVDQRTSVVPPEDNEETTRMHELYMNQYFRNQVNIENNNLNNQLHIYSSLPPLPPLPHIPMITYNTQWNRPRHIMVNGDIYQLLNDQEATESMNTEEQEELDSEATTASEPCNRDNSHNENRESREESMDEDDLEVAYYTTRRPRMLPTPVNLMGNLMNGINHNISQESKEQTSSNTTSENDDDDTSDEYECGLLNLGWTGSIQRSNSLLDLKPSEQNNIVNEESSEESSYSSDNDSEISDITNSDTFDDDDFSALYANTMRLDESQHALTGNIESSNSIKRMEFEANDLYESNDRSFEWCSNCTHRKSSGFWSNECMHTCWKCKECKSNMPEYCKQNCFWNNGHLQWSIGQIDLKAEQQQPRFGDCITCGIAGTLCKKHQYKNDNTMTPNGACCSRIDDADVCLD
jgi:hypothetical protein